MDNLHAMISTASNLARRPRHANGEPVFVLGMWRSGTSLLYALLNQHPDIQLLYESDLPLLWPLFLSPARYHWASRLDFWNAALRRHGVRPETLDEASDLASAFSALGRQYARNHDATIWGCKSPNYYVIVPSLARMFPRGRYLFLWRDPSEICLSITRAGENSHWFHKRGMCQRVLVGCEMLKGSCESLRRSGVAIHELYYRDLAEDPARQLRVICDFLKIPFDSRMTSLEGADLSAIYDGDHHQLLRNTSVVVRIRQNADDVLSPGVISKIERYKASWRNRYPEWPLARTDAAVTPVSRSERLADRLLVSVLQLDRAAPRWLFCFLPTWCWRMYRRLRYKDPDRWIFSPAMRPSPPHSPVEPNLATTAGSESH